MKSNMFVKIATAMVVLALLAGSVIYFMQDRNKIMILPIEDLVLARASNGEQFSFKVEVATKPRQWANGLMHRVEMAEDEGMLFVFRDSAIRSFWMKDTKIPLDMLFISEDGTISQIYYEAQPFDEDRIVSVYPTKAVLEINAGLSERHGFTLGDKILHPAFKTLAQEQELRY